MTGGCRAAARLEVQGLGTGEGCGRWGGVGEWGRRVAGVPMGLTGASVCMSSMLPSLLVSVDDAASGKRLVESACVLAGMGCRWGARACD